MRQRLLSAVKICPRYIVKRHFTSSSAQCQSNQAERYAEMLAYLKQRTSNLSTNLSAKRSALETRFSALSQEISRVSGYTDIEALKNEVHEHGMFFACNHPGLCAEVGLGQKQCFKQLEPLPRKRKRRTGTL